MIIDFHVHTFPDKLAPKVIPKLAEAAGIEPQTDATVGDTLNKMKEWGIDRAVILNIATAPSQQNTINNVAAENNKLPLYTFGSVNTPEFTDKSDIDLLIDFEAGINAEDYTDNYFSLREKLAQLFNRDIDLVTRRSLSNPFFIREVEQTKSLIYG